MRRQLPLLARRVPFTLTVLAVMILAFVVPAMLGIQNALRPFVVIGQRPLLRDGRWWAPLTSSIFADSVWELLFTLVVVALLIGIAENLMGTRRTVLAYVVTAFAGAYVGVGLQVLAGWNNTFWVGQVELHGSMDATRIALGVIAAASAFASAMWRRRIRAILLVVCFVFLLFSGNPPGLYRLATVVAGIVLGWSIQPEARLVRWVRSSHHEIRVLAAAAVALTAFGPIIAVFTTTRFGLLAPMAALTTGTLVPEPGDPQCNLLNLTAACERLLVNQTQADDISWAAFAVGAGMLVVAFFLLRGLRWALWTAVGLFGAFAIWSTVYYILFPTIFPAGGPGAGTPHLHIEQWRTGVSIAATILLPAALAITLVLLRRHFAIVPERGELREALQRRVRRTGGERATTTQSHAITGRARSLAMTTQGGSSLAHMATWQGNRYWFDETGSTGIAYRVVNGVALTVGGPFGQASRYADAVASFARFCDDHARHPVFYSVDESLEPTFDQMAWHILTVAEEAVIDLPEWTLAGNRNKDVRTAVNKASREGLSSVWTTYESLSIPERSQIAEISEAWVADKNLPEMSFTLGGLAELDDPAVRLMLAVAQGGRIEAVTSWMPIHRDGALTGWTLDFMRRRPDSPGGVMEFLIAAAAERGQADGLTELSLSGVPLARTDPAAATTGLDGALGALSRILEPHYGFHSLMRFKRKFHPRHRRLLMAYPDPSRLGQIGIALTGAYLPTLSVRQTMRLISGR